MYGIVGLHLKNAALYQRFGALLVPMLECMSSRGPDSAVVALHDGDTMEVVKDVGSPAEICARYGIVDRAGFRALDELVADDVLRAALGRVPGGERTRASRRQLSTKRRRVVLLTPTELERLTIFSAAELARKRKERGLKLNHPEAVAIIVDEVMERARDGKSVAELISYGSTILSTDDVMPGVADLMPFLQVEPVLKTGTKLVTIHEPIRAGKEKVEGVAPGEIATEEGEIEINAGRRRTKVAVVNTGDRPVQVGSHFHFFEANRELEFDREKAFGMHLDVPAGTAKRFAPGEQAEVTLVEFGGTGEVWGLNNLTNGSVRSAATKKLAIERARQHGFKGA